jgi:hypothetical protein
VPGGDLFNSCLASGHSFSFPLLPVMLSISRLGFRAPLFLPRLISLLYGLRVVLLAKPVLNVVDAAEYDRLSGTLILVQPAVRLVWQNGSPTFSWISGLVSVP